MAKMNIIEFITAYCQDMITSFRDHSKLVEWTILPHTDVIEDDEGKRIPVVFIDGEAVHVRDFIEMERDEFVDVHHTPSAGEIYDNYIEGLEILEGPEVVMRFRNAAKMEAQKLQEQAQLYDSDLVG